MPEWLRIGIMLVVVIMVASMITAINNDWWIGGKAK